MYRVNLDSIQVAVIFSMFQIAPVLDVGFHLAAAGESVHPTFAITLFGFPGGVWIATKTQCVNIRSRSVCLCVF